MKSAQGFKPNWVSAPGDTIADILKERNLSMADFCQRAGFESNAAKDLIIGRAAITIAIARKLEDTLGPSVQFWMSRDFQYREDSADRAPSRDEWLNDLPLRDMIKFGWIASPGPGKEFPASLRYFNVSSIQEWNRKYAGISESSAFRTSRSFNSSSGAVAAWLRQGELVAETIACRPWNSARFKKSLPDIRALSRRKNPQSFLPELQKFCADSGVAVTVVRAPTGCRASGATRFLSRDKALLQLSFRYLSDDHFWFTFFHEAGHLILHGETKLFLEGSDAPQTTAEKEADKFAEDIIIPGDAKSEFMSLRPTMRDVIRFSIRTGVAPGIVVGQLQHFGRIRHNQMNYLKRRYVWID